MESDDRSRVAASLLQLRAQESVAVSKWRCRKGVPWSQSGRFSGSFRAGCRGGGGHGGVFADTESTFPTDGNGTPDPESFHPPRPGNLWPGNFSSGVWIFFTGPGKICSWTWKVLFPCPEKRLGKDFFFILFLNFFFFTAAFIFTPPLVLLALGEP